MREAYRLHKQGPRCVRLASSCLGGGYEVIRDCLILQHRVRISLSPLYDIFLHLLLDMSDVDELQAAADVLTLWPTEHITDFVC